MKLINRLCWLVLGIAIGVGITFAARPVHAAQGIRLTNQEAGGWNYLHAEFVTDSKSGGCWFVVSSRDANQKAVGVAVAPPQACVQ